METSCSINKALILLHLILLFCFMALPLTAHAGPEDNIDEYIEDAHQGANAVPAKGNLVAVPIPVSNPTVGTGLQAVLMYLHPKRLDDSRSPNANSGLAGMYTDTNSWLAGIFHDNYWAEDKYRFTGFLGWGEFNLAYYGIGDDSILRDNPIDYELTVFSFMPQFQRRIPSTENWFGGVHYLYIDSDNRFKTSQLIPGLPDVQGRIRSAGLGLLTTYDSRDNNYYPTQGQWFQAKWTNYGEHWGGDQGYNKFTGFINHYQPVGSQAVLALRGNIQASEGDTPFFDLPFLNLRGVSRSRYQDQFTLSMHAEGRYKFRPRWGTVAFVEAGWFGDDFGNLSSSRTIVSYGGGVRWQVTKEKDLNCNSERIPRRFCLTAVLRGLQGASILG